MKGKAYSRMPDRLAGTITLHNANWKTDALATTVQIPQAVLAPQSRR